MPSEAFFTDIRTVLLRKIGLAKHSIHVAVAWFTDRVLFAALLERQQGIAIALCLARDEGGINFQPGGLPFAELEAAGRRGVAVGDAQHLAWESVSTYAASGSTSQIIPDKASALTVAR